MFRAARIALLCALVALFCLSLISAQSSSSSAAAVASSSSAAAVASSSSGAAAASSSTGAVVARSSSSSGAVATSSSSGSAVLPSGSSCVGAGYDFSSVAAAGDLNYSVTGTNNVTTTYFVHLCGNVTSAGGCTGQFCQGGTTLSSFDPSQALWFAGPVANTNVTQRLQDGAQCTINGFTFNRESELVLSCNAAAITPYISSYAELHSCYYQVVIQTAAACAPSANAPATGPAGGVLTTYYDSRCGAGKYNLSSLQTSDLSVVAGGNTWYLRVCGAVSQSACSGTTNSAFGGETAELCQVSGSNAYAASYYAPSSQLWTITSTGLNLYVQDGASCGSYAREMQILFVCSPSATTPVLTNVTESPQCYYAATIQTSAVCASSVVAPGSSSSAGTSTGGGGGVIAPGSSSASVSSGSSAAARSSSAASSSTGVVAAASSSSSSAAATARSSSSAAATASSSSTAVAARSSSSSSSSTASPSTFVTSSSSSTASSTPTTPSSAGSSAGPASPSTGGESSVVPASSSTAGVAPPIPASGASATSAVSALLVAVVGAMMALLL